MSSANRDSFTSSFQIQMPFISFSYLIALEKTANKVLNSSGGSRHPCLVPDLREKALSFTIKYDSCVFLVDSLYQLEEIPFSFIRSLLSVFVKKGCRNLSDAFSPSVEMVIWFLSYILLLWCITLIDFWMLSQSCIPHLVMVYNPL